MFPLATINTNSLSEGVGKELPYILRHLLGIT
jgi:hypothetical protein